MEEFVVEFIFERSTKGTHRFAELVPAGREEVIGALYIKKSKMPTPVQRLRITVEEA